VDQDFLEEFNLNLNSYERIVMNLPREEIPVRMAAEVVRLGHLSLWKWQHFMNHEHPCFQEFELPHELEVMDLWKSQMQAQMPEVQFVIELEPMNRITWYQPFGDAPTESDDWTRFGPPIRLTWEEIAHAIESMGMPVPEDFESLNDLHRRAIADKLAPCSKCRVEGNFTEGAIDPLHPGIKWRTCLACGEWNIFETRVVRYLLQGKVTPT
jgi:hypothetical protein